ncbi:hypothetical protein AND_006985 [Anopheles darlingi]|uniref:Secreted protein n=1 Tax=Anopheles darlingi TaxID=43151 RepID=W5JA74_ANODA|nr:uncharacterized protein LOC125957007 [Anopheles darlingi]ETN61357.1 hypothetical protein AND_006985 [Anopheles darlingi]
MIPWQRFLLFGVVTLFALLADRQQQQQTHGATGAMASIIYAGYKLPMPHHRTFYKSFGERKIGPNLYEVTTIIQEDILIRKQCECMVRYRCRVPRNIFYLDNHDCHHRERVCCEMLENAYESTANETRMAGDQTSDNEI